MRKSNSWIVIVGIAAAACAAPAANVMSREDMDRRQKDSILGASVMPGAHGVTRALGAADISDARNAATDSATQD